MDRENPKKIGLLKAALAVSLLPSFAFSQAKMPATDTDLHAAYCIAIENNEIAYYSDSVKQLGAVPGELTNALRAVDEPKLELAKANMRKLGQYLVPRLAFIDIIALSTAQQSGQDDIDRVGAAFRECHGDDPCLFQKIADLATLRAKTQTCRELIWLPL